MTARTGAAAVIIGNEVLSAKVQEKNGTFLIQRLRESGIVLRSLAIVPDEVDAIVDAVARAKAAARYVFTSGGIGPTHDDVTVRAVSLALGRRVVRLPEIEQRIRDHYGDSMTPEALRLAEAPEGSELLHQPGIWYPVLCCDDVFLLPGVPKLFRAQLEAVLARLEGAPLSLRCLFLRLGESAIAHALDDVALSMPDVAIGSYPQFEEESDHRVKVTVEHLNPKRVDEAVERLVERLPTGAVVRTE